MVEDNDSLYLWKPVATEQITLDVEKIRMIKSIADLAFDASNHWYIIEQYNELFRCERDVMAMSSGFHSVTFSAHLYAVLMCLSRIFDRDSRSIGLSAVINAVRNESAHVLWGGSEHVDGFDGTQPTWSYPLNVETDKEFIDFLITNKQRTDIRFQCLFRDIWSEHDGEKSLDIRVDMTFDEYIEWIDRKRKTHESKVLYLREERDKVLAHNDKDALLLGHDSLLLMSHIKELVDFALFATRVLTGAFTNVSEPDTYSNISDLRNTVQHVKRSMAIPYEWDID